MTSPPESLFFDHGCIVRLLLLDAVFDAKFQEKTPFPRKNPVWHNKFSTVAPEGFQMAGDFNTDDTKFDHDHSNEINLKPVLKVWASVAIKTNFKI